MKQILIPLLFLLSLATLASAGFIVNLDPEGRLANQSIQATQTITYGFNITAGNVSSGYTCYLYTNENGSSGLGTFVNAQTISSVANNTNYNFTARNGIKETVANAYKWAVNCTSSEGIFNWSLGNSTHIISNYTYGVDVSAPTVTINTPSAGNFFNTNNTAVFNITVVDNNAGVCSLETSINYSSVNQTYRAGTFNKQWENFTYTNNTWFNFTKVNATGYFNFSEDNGGAYSWNYRCNDTAGNIATLSANRTFYVDVTVPAAFTIDVNGFHTDHRQLWNNSHGTDYSPTFGWVVTTDNNFSRYEIFWTNNSLTRSATGFFAANVTNISINVSNASTLGADINYYVNVTAWDTAGNKRQMTTIGYNYQTFSTNQQLKAGWNIFGNTGDNFTLSEILNWSGATTASVWNATHEFNSHVSGGSFGGTVVTPGSVVLIYLSNDTTFNDMIYNTTSITSRAVNLTNQSASDWNLIMNVNWSSSYRFNQIDNFSNNCLAYADCDYTNVTFFSYFNTSANTGNKLVSYVSNFTVNNGTSIPFGGAVWAYMARGQHNISIDWGTIGNY